MLRNFGCCGARKYAVGDVRPGLQLGRIATGCGAIAAQHIRMSMLPNVTMHVTTKQDKIMIGDWATEEQENWCISSTEQHQQYKNRNRLATTEPYGRVQTYT